MRMIFACLLSLFLAACATPSVKPDPVAREVSKAPGDGFEQLYSPVCQGASRLSADHCGLLSPGPEAEHASLPTPTCSPSSLECNQREQASLESRWKLRYPKADAAEVQAWCSSAPLECQNAALLELHWMDSHNSAVLKEFHLSRMDVKLHALRYYARIRREQREAGFLKDPVEKPEAEDEAAMLTAAATPVERKDVK